MLLDLCRDASDTEIFLIATAALARKNMIMRSELGFILLFISFIKKDMTFMDSIACEFLNQFNTSQIIIENCYLKNHSSIFIKDQVIYFIFLN
jgi:hypothetical protein